MEDAEYRKKIQETLTKIQSAFDQVDPDVAECDLSHGALSVKFSDGTKCILSSQPSVKQLWMAVAGKGIAFHFNWDSVKCRWIDDKGQGVEVLNYLRQLVKSAAGIDVVLD